MSDDCSGFFSNIIKTTDKNIAINELDLSYNNIINCVDRSNSDNVINFLFRHVFTCDIYNIKNTFNLLFDKIISIVKSNTPNNKYNKVEATLFNKLDNDNNNWLQIFIKTIIDKCKPIKNTNYDNIRDRRDVITTITTIIDKYIKYINVDNINNDGNNALLLCANIEYLNDISLKYLATETNINHTNTHGKSAILACLYWPFNIKLLDKLLDRFSNIDINIIDNDGYNVLLNLIRYSKDITNKKLVLDIIQKLIDNNINLKYTTPTGKNALSIAYTEDNLDIFKIIFNTLIRTDIEYVKKSVSSFINTSLSSNIDKYIKNSKYQSNYIPLLIPATNMIPSPDIAIKYGTELEICVRLDKKCIGRDIDTITALNASNKWYKLVEIFLDNYIKQRAKTDSTFKKLVDKLYKIYKFIIITDTPKNKEYNCVYDLSTLELISKKGTIDYTSPIITTDGSVVCGDYAHLYNSNGKSILNSIKKIYNISDENNIEHTFHIEFVTPILTCIPLVFGKNGISYDLSPLTDLFLLIGMDKKGCYVTNKSQGYHVNLSLVNKRTGKGLPLLREFFNSQFFKDYSDWEKMAYPKYRKNKSEYAKPLYSLENNNIYSHIYKNKYVTLHRKDLPELVEIRLFGSSHNFTELVSRTTEVIALLYSSYNKWYSDIKMSIYPNNTRKNNTKKKSRYNYNDFSRIPKSVTPGINREKRFKTRNKRK
jgi:hypothetical protein